MTKTLLSIGHGYTARALAPRLLAKGWRVIGTTRTREKAATLVDEGVEALVWPDTALPLGAATHLLTSVAPGEGGDPVLGDRPADEPRPAQDQDPHQSSRIVSASPGVTSSRSSWRSIGPNTPSSQPATNASV